MYQISSFQRWLSNTYSNTIWRISPFWVWMADKYEAEPVFDKFYYSIKNKVFKFTKQEKYIYSLLENYHYPLTSDQIIKLMNAKVVVSQYEYN